MLMTFRELACNDALLCEIERLKAELARQGDAQAALMSLARQYNLVVRERNEIAAMYHQALENAQQAEAKAAMLQAELSALQPNWDICSENERKYRYCAPSAIYQPRFGRSRLAKHWAGELYRHRWMGGIVYRELMALAKHEGLYATHRELARLRAYAADWDATAEQMLNDSIPW